MKHVIEQKKLRVLVTGANGYLGRHVVKAILDKGHDVFAADFNLSGLDSRAIPVSEPIFSDRADIYDAFGRPDVCLHLAWRNGFIHNAESHIIDLPNHFEFVRKMVEGGLPQLCVMGTMHEIGYWEGPIDENTPTNPSSYYGIAKNSLRQMVNVITKDKPTIVQWTRAYYIIGDDARSSSIFAKIVQANAKGQTVFPFNSGRNQYDFIDVDTLAMQIASVISQTEVSGVINCCTGEPVALATKVESFIKQNEFNIKLDYGVFPDRPYDSPGVWGNADKINKILNESVHENR